MDARADEEQLCERFVLLPRQRDERSHVTFHFALFKIAYL